MANTGPHGAGGSGSTSASSSANTRFYTLLNVSPNANQDEIAKAFKKLALDYHPDRHSDEQERQLATARFTELNAVYEVLSDPAQRHIYDTLGEQAIRSGLKVSTHVAKSKEVEKVVLEERLREELLKVDRSINVRGTLQFPVTYVHSASLDVDGDEGNSEENDQGSLSFPAPTFKQSLKYRIGNRDVLHCSAAIRRSQIQGLAEGPLAQHDFSDLEDEDGHNPGKGEQKGRVNGPLENGSQWQSWSFKWVHSLDKGGSITNLTTAAGHVVRYTFPLSSSTVGYCAAGLDRRSGDIKSMLVGAQQSLSKSTQAQMQITTSIRRHPRFQNMPVLGFGGMWGITERRNDWHAGATANLGNTDIALRLSAGYSSTDKDDVEFEADFDLLRGIRSCTRISSVYQDRPNTSFGLDIECGAGSVTIQPRGSRLKQKVVIPFQIGVALSPLQRVAAAVLPTAVGVLLQTYVVKAIRQYYEQLETEAARAMSEEEVKRRQQEAHVDIQLMKNRAQLRKAKEEQKQGLVVESAMYGVLKVNAAGKFVPVEGKAVDVSIPMQYMVDKSKLQVVANFKADLPGFYDPAPNEDKVLYLQYRFQGAAHEVIVDDNKPLRAPLKEHRVKT